MPTPVYVLGKAEWRPFFERANHDVPSLFSFEVSNLTDESQVQAFVEDAFQQREDSFVLPFYQEYAEAARRALASSPMLQQRVIAPANWIFETFEGRTSGKGRTRQWLLSHGFERNVLREWNDTDLGAVALPAVVKPVKGSFGEGIRIVKTREQLQAAVTERTGGASSSSNLDPYSRVIIQEAVLGKTEWGVYFVALHGTLLRSLCVEYAFHSTLFVRRGGAAPRVETKPCHVGPFRMHELRQLVNATRYNGFGCLGLKERTRGASAAVFEMNTRPCGWLVTSSPRRLEGMQNAKWLPLTNLMYPWLTTFYSERSKEREPNG